MAKKEHPWRPCPLGQHWVREHPRTVSVSKKHSDGRTIVDGHCRNNPSGHEIFKPEEPLDPNLVKALIANESDFKSGSGNTSREGKVTGLIQLTEKTRKILADQKGELKDFLITVSKDEIKDPNVNICSGIRWLFHKKNLVSHHLKREATWMEAISEYKGIRTQLGKVKRADDIMREVEENYKHLKTQKVPKK